MSNPITGGGCFLTLQNLCLASEKREQVPVYFIFLELQAQAWVMSSSANAKTEPLQVPGRIIVSYSTGQTQLGNGVPGRHLGTSWEN